jgi:hypothetical protein
MFAQSKNCGARETAIANSSEAIFVSRQWPQNKRDKQPLLGSHQHTSGLA